MRYLLCSFRGVFGAVVNPRKVEVWSSLPGCTQGQVAHGLSQHRDVEENVAIVAFADSVSEPLLVLAAKNSFWQLGMSFLAILGRFLGVEIKSDDTEYERLHRLVAHVLPDLSQDHLFDIIAKRMKPPSDWGEFLLDGFVTDLIDEKDLQKIEAEVAAMRSRLRRTPSAPSTSSSARRPRGTNAQTLGGRRTHTHTTVGGAPCRGTWTGCDLDLAAAAAMTPAPCRLYKDCVDGRWQVYYLGVASRSRSFKLHGAGEALRQALAWAWSEVLLRAGFAVSECPIEGLFPAAAAEGSPGAAAAAAASST